MLPTLTLNAGLRYDFQKIAQPTVRNPDAQLLAAGLDTSSIPEDSNNFAPRLGFAWTPGNDDRTVVRGGYGIFYGRTPAIMIGTAHSNNGINVQTITFTGAQIPTYPTILTAVADRRDRPDVRRSSRSIPDFENPEVHQASLGVERGITSDISVSLDLAARAGERPARARATSTSARSIP